MNAPTTDLHKQASTSRRAVTCRANSRRGQTDAANLSYQPVQAVQRALMLLRTVSRQRISTISSLYKETGIPKPTIVRMLETLITEGYVVRDNMCGGYLVTSRVESLGTGYWGLSRLIEVSRPLAVLLTQRIKWPVGLAIVDEDEISIQFWTGTISPWAYTNTTLGLKPDLLTSAMGRAYLAFTSPANLERLLKSFRDGAVGGFDAEAASRVRARVEQIRQDGFAVRDPRTPPFRLTTLAIPVLEDDIVRALISVSFFTSAVPRGQINKQIVEPLLEFRSEVESALNATESSHGHGQPATYRDGIDMAF